MASALEKNAGIKRELEALVEQAEGVRSSEPVTPGLPNEGQPTLTEVVTPELIAPKTDQTSERDMSYWKQRALTAEGRYNTLKPKLDDTIHTLRLQLQAATDQNKNFVKQLEDLKPDPLKEQLGQKQVIDVLGEETVQAITSSIEQTRKSVQDQLAKVKATAESTNRDTAYESFVTKARSLALEGGADIEKLNFDKRFHQYLDGNRSPRGHLLRTLFNQAVASMDADSVAAYFTDFVATLRSTNGKEDLREVNDTIASRMSPSSSSAPSDLEVATSNSKVPRITLAFINKFNQDLAKGLYKTRYSEMVSIQKAIENAYATNQIFDK